MGAAPLQRTAIEVIREANIGGDALQHCSFWLLLEGYLECAQQGGSTTSLQAADALSSAHPQAAVSDARQGSTTRFHASTKPDAAACRLLMHCCWP